MKFSIKYLWKYVKANLFTSLIFIDTRCNLDPTCLDKIPIFLIDSKVIIFANNRINKMIKLAIIFLPIVFALIWALFIGLRINRVETRDGKRKLVNY